MKILKTMFLINLSFMAYSAYGNIEDKKAKMLSKIDAKIEMLQKKKSCISAANNKQALKSCKANYKEEKKAIKSKRIDRKIQKLQNQKNQIMK